MLRRRLKIRAIFSLVVILLALGTMYRYLPVIFGDSVYPLRYDEHIIKYAQEYNLDSTLVAAVIFQESRFNTQAVSPKGARGLMQIMPATARMIAKELGAREYDLFNPETSIRFGSWYLRTLLDKYNGDVEFALAAYNAGSGNVDKWAKAGLMDNIPFRETNAYVKKIQGHQAVYSDMYGDRLGVRGTGTLVAGKWSEGVKMEKIDNDFDVRGRIWSQIIANVFSIFKGDEK
ncbi:MAG: Soluble lytic murein transglycosylase precursor [bacterium ADurb.Bin400]|nr:MAG: Soluble lytic murein transglycosylase precursor [bacterium ADurb.Bin400]